MCVFLLSSNYYKLSESKKELLYFKLFRICNEVVVKDKKKFVLIGILSNSVKKYYLSVLHVVHKPRLSITYKNNCKEKNLSTIQLVHYLP